ncbi:MAG: putative lipid II flippase FtsW [Deltaproteobacteria bacterium]|nr:putative lipid II flippase FtsW [Deltaproteobacteria bacterium]RLB92669.1 MAG: putative lipid II flippase FtsW [Deltaproteobacteria bacterium]RLC10877.1 MAG: putative lipid II flippase FtsW [Deltaproteobacteria bacterium]
MTNNKRAKDHGGYDPFLLIGVIILLGVGVVMVYSASSLVAAKRFGNGSYFFHRQLLYALAAILVMVCCRHVPYTFYRTMAYPIVGAAFLLLVAVWVPDIGYEVGGARRWLRFFGISFQPSEFAQLALIIYLAYSTSKKQKDIKRFSIGFLPHGVVFFCFSALIVMQPDFGMAAMIALVVWIMLFVGGVRISYLLAALAGALPLAYYLLIHAGYRLKRLAGFAAPWQYQGDAGYQIVHSLMAFGSGGIFGAGVGNSYQKLFYLPEPHTDFIFSVIGEELGLLGVCFITGLYIMLLWRGVMIAIRAREPFATFLAAGLTVALGIHVCINEGVALGLLPTKGLTLPFVSYGGSSLVMNAASVGILMNIAARQAA